MLISFVVLSAFSESIEPWKMDNPQIVLFFPFIAAIFGYFLAWKYELSGGIIAFISTFMFMILSGVANLFTYAMIFSAIAFVAAGIAEVIINNSELAVENK